MPFNELVVYIGFVVGFALTPGPNMMLFLTYTFEYGRKAGWTTAAGIVSSFVIHITAVVLGLTALLVTMPYALEMLRYCGIAYLLYLAIRNLKNQELTKPSESGKGTRLRRFYFSGFIGNLLNPGSIFLYFSILPQYIHPERGGLMTQSLLLGGIQMLGSFMTNCTVIFFAGYATKSFLENEKYQQRLRVIMSFLIIVFALRMLFIQVK